MEASNEGFGNRHFAPSALRMAGSLAPHEDLPLLSHGAPRLVILTERAGRARGAGSVIDQCRTADNSTRYLPRGTLLKRITSRSPRGSILAPFSVSTDDNMSAD